MTKLVKNSDPRSPEYFKNKWNTRIEQTIANTRKKLLKTNAKYEGNY